jgi:hypothetical protein
MEIGIVLRVGPARPEWLCEVEPVSEFASPENPIAAKAGRYFDHSKFVARASDAAPVHVLCAIASANAHAPTIENISLVAGCQQSHRNEHFCHDLHLASDESSASD